MLQSIFLIEHPGQVSSTQVYIHFAEFIQISLFSSPDKRIFNVNNEHPSVIVVDLASPLIGITLGKYFFERVFPQPGSCSSADVNGFRKMAEDRRRGVGEGWKTLLARIFSRVRRHNQGGERGEASFADRINGFGNVLPVFSGAR